MTMHKSHSYLSLACSIWFGMTSPSHAKLAFGESLDWLVTSRPHIAIGKVVEVRDGELPSGALYLHRRIDLRIEKTLKGKPPEKATWLPFVPADTQVLKHGQGKNAPPSVGAEFLLFFSDKEELNYAIDLSFPTQIYNLAYTQDFSVLLTKQAILDAVSDRLARLEKEHGEKGKDREWKGMSLPVPEGTEAYRSLYSGSACFLIVPEDPEYKAKLLKATRSSDVHERARAAYWLKHYSGDDTTRQLKVLLEDSGTSTLGGIEGETKVYPARQAAYLSLKALGIEVEKPEGYYDNYPDWFLH